MKVQWQVTLSPKCALYMPCASVSRLIIGGHEDALAAPESCAARMK